MAAQVLELGRRRFVVLPERDYRRLIARAGLSEADNLPVLPKADARGEYPAVEFARVSLARKIIARRRTAGLSQAELARRAGVRAETLNRIERGKTTPDVATIAKLDHALRAAGTDAGT